MDRQTGEHILASTNTATETETDGYRRLQVARLMQPRLQSERFVSVGLLYCNLPHGI